MRYSVSILIISVLALMTLGTVMLCSAPAGFVSNNFEKQLAFCVLGLLACACAASVDYLLLRKWSKWLYGLTVILLLLVLIVGTARGGARRWFNLGFMLFQPSELAKLALIVILAHYMEWNQRQMDRLGPGLINPLLLAGPVLFLVLLEPDFGTTILLGTVTGVLLFLGGVPKRNLAAAALAGTALIAVFILCDPVRLGRVTDFGKDLVGGRGGAPVAREVNFHTRQSVIAVGSGGLTGHGLGGGIMKLGAVPENHTDFIYSVIGEELGFVVALPVALAYFLIFLSGLRISCRAREGFGRYLGFGITFLIGLQAFVNIGVVTGVLPNKGLPLPFVSYGGSSLVMMLTCVGLLLNVARHAVDHDQVLAEPGLFADPYST